MLVQAKSSFFKKSIFLDLHASKPNPTGLVRIIIIDVKGVWTMWSLMSIILFAKNTLEFLGQIAPCQG